MALLRIQDMGEPAAQLAAEAAIRLADPQASISPDWRIGVVEVAGTVPTETLCASLRFGNSQRLSLHFSNLGEMV